jgi:hypothetical protein
MSAQDYPKPSGEKLRAIRERLGVKPASFFIQYYSQADMPEAASGAIPI